MCKNLQGKKLTVVSIHRKGIFDMDAMAFICENCGRVIVNSAIVKDETNKTYVIGLDCKKTLIDKPIIDRLESNKDKMDCFIKQDVKDYKHAQSTITKVLAYLDNEKMSIEVSNQMNWFNVKDMTKTNQFGMIGESVYSQNLGYLFKIGLKDVLQSAANKGIIKLY
jgi:hypothetical protein